MEGGKKLKRSLLKFGGTVMQSKPGILQIQIKLLLSALLFITVCTIFVFLVIF
jgi:hypothetical protein